VQAAARTGREILTDEAERAIGSVLAGPLPESAVRAFVEHKVFERVASELVEIHAVERWLASDETERFTEVAVNRVVRSPEFRQVLLEVLASDEVRRALSQQTSTFGSEAAAALRRRVRRRDEQFELHRKPARTSYAGLGSRGVGLVIDAVLAQLVFVAAAASITLVLSLAGGLTTGWLSGTLAGSGWLLVAAAYFTVFWSGTGQTPGMRLMGVRVVGARGTPPSPVRSFVRFVGLIFAIVPLFAGFLPVLVDNRRRALHDFLAGTVVVYEAEDDAASGSLKETPSDWAAGERMSATPQARNHSSTPRTSSSGVDAPAVTPTVSTSPNQRSSSAPSSSTR
jgi:uncharacterized RDD family membrane protein YckC